MDLKFYYAPMSASTRVHWALEELGVPYEKIKLDLAAGDQQKPEYLALNPNGKVPLLVADGQPIFESLAILLYLGERFGVDKGLFPPSNPDRAEALKWMVWGTVTLADAAARLARNTWDRFPAEERNEKAAARAREDVIHALGVLNQALAGKEYLVGNQFSLVEVSMVTSFWFLPSLGIDLTPYPNVTAWVARWKERPALKRVIDG
jgi:glutathione S-transferase